MERPRPRARAMMTFNGAGLHLHLHFDFNQIPFKTKRFKTHIKTNLKIIEKCP
jgi:hypothetical protein